MMSCAAGKDVYSEKPMTVFVREGRWMTDVARKHKSVVQIGTQQRSGKHYQHARQLMQSGYIGKIMSVRFGSSRNITPGFMVAMRTVFVKPDCSGHVTAQVEYVDPTIGNVGILLQPASVRLCFCPTAWCVSIPSAPTRWMI